MADTHDYHGRLVRLETQLLNLAGDLEETREVLHKVSNQVMTLGRQLDAFTNQGKGATLVFRVFLALGGMGWLSGIIALLQNLSPPK